MGNSDTTERYFAPTMGEHRTLSLALLDADDEADGVGAAGTWAYHWHGRDEVGGFPTMDGARDAALVALAERWPGLRPAGPNDLVPLMAWPGHLSGLAASAQEGR